MQILLASTSPRRRELLGLLGLPFHIIPPSCEETLSSNLSPDEQSRQLARDKAQSVADQHPQDLVVGSDTVIEIEGRLLGKPQNMQEAETMLRNLRGKCPSSPYGSGHHSTVPKCFHRFCGNRPGLDQTL